MEADQPGQIGIDPRSCEPSYQQLAKILAQQIVGHHGAGGDRLPQERALAAKYRVSRFTVRNALHVLEAQGLIQRVRGKGTFAMAGEPARRWFSTASTILFVETGGKMPWRKPPPGSYYGRIHAGVRQMARTLGFQLQVESTRNTIRIQLDEYKPPQPSEVGGVIICGTFDEDYVRMFSSEGVPTVVADFWSHDSGVDSVIVDVESDAYMAIDHLAERGHTSVGFVGAGRREAGDICMYDPDIWRFLDHLRRAVQRRRVEVRDEWVILVPNEKTKLYKATRDLLSLRQRPTALICFDISTAEQALRAIGDARLRCPEDISLLSRGDVEVAGRKTTCLLGDPDMMGRLAVRLLIERMKGQRQRAVRVAVTTSLVPGETTGPAPVTAP